MCSMGTVNSFCPPCNAFCALWSDCLSHSSHGNPDFKKCTKLFAFYPSHPFLQAAWHDCNSSMHTRGHFCNTQLSSWKPQGSCSSPAGPEDMCHNLVKTCLSRYPGARREHGRVRALRRKCHQISRCAVWDFSLAHKEKMNWLKCYTSPFVLSRSCF